MPVAIVATVGGSTSNSYCTLAEAEIYIASIPTPGSWTSSVLDDTKNRALVQACRLIEENFTWNGYPVTPEVQSLSWPQYGQYLRTGKIIANTEIPQDLKNAQVELARQLLAADRTADQDAAAQGITAVSAGPVSVQFNTLVATFNVIPDAVFSILSWYGFASNSGVMKKLERY